MRTFFQCISIFGTISFYVCALNVNEIKEVCYSPLIYAFEKKNFYSTSYFLSEKDPGAVKIVSHILKSLFY